MRRYFRDGNLALQRAGVDYWASCGTLLGIVRENRLLPHDRDVDFATFEWTRHELIAKEFESLGYEMRTVGVPHYGYEQAFFLDGKHAIDVFYFYVAGPNRTWQGSYVGDQLLWSEFDLDIFLPTQAYRFRGTATRLPAHPEKVCEARYGDWRTPVTEWHYDTDPNCLTEVKW